MKLKETHNAESAAEIIAGKINFLLSEKKEIIVGFPGGRSIKHLLEALKKKDMSWEKIHLFMVDERLVLHDDKESNFSLIKENLLDFLLKEKKIPPDNIHPFILKNTKDHGIKEYENEFRKYGGAFDIAFFGVGEDGHIASLFPKRSVSISAPYFITTHDSPKPPKDRMSASRELISKTGFGVFLFIGESKREAYERFVNPTITAEECPAKLAYKIKEALVLKAL